MMSKVQEKEKAIRLRKRGFTYKEILSKLPVAKSSLSLWFKDLPLTEKEKSYLRARKDSNIAKGRIRAASAIRNNRLKREKIYVEEAKQEFYKRERHPLFLVGVALYWAEGTKRTGAFMFMNSDPEMIVVLVKWLEVFEGFKRADLGYRLYIHKPYAHENCEKFWADHIGVPRQSFKKTIYKPTTALVKKRPNYKGCLRIEPARGAKLLFKMKVWQNMLASKCMRP